MITDSMNLTEMIAKHVSNQDLRSIRTIFQKMELADIGEIINQYPKLESISLFRLVPLKKRSEIFTYLDVELQLNLLDELPEATIKPIINLMEPVDRTKFLEILSPEIKNSLLDMLSPDEKVMARSLLSYPEDSAGRIMSPEFISLKNSKKIKDAMEEIRWHAGKFPEEAIQNIFVVDEQDHFLGMVSLARLVTADPPTNNLDSLIGNTVETISAFDSELEAVDYFRKYDRYVIPVVNKDILVGAIYSDDVFDVAEEEATEDIQLFGGSATLEDSYFNTSKWEIFRKRAGWLAVLFVGMMGTANALEHFEGVIREMTYLIAFLPLIISSGGNSGSQAASIMIRGLAVKEMELSDWFKILRREIIIGIGLGLILGVLGFIRAYFGTSPSTNSGIIVALSLVGIVTFGAVIGSMLPFLLKMLKLDPAVSSSPMISSVVDIVGIIIFFNIALLIHGAF